MGTPRKTFKNRRKVVTVRGSGLFPVDMLRYDHAWPRTESDSYKVDMGWQSGGASEMRDVELLTDDPPAPNYGRWKSFTWQVVSVRDVED